MKTEEEHQADLIRITELWEAEPNTPDVDELDKPEASRLSGEI